MGIHIITIYRERLQNGKKRKKESDIKEEEYQTYLFQAREILVRNNIDNIEKCKLLQEECKRRLNPYERGFEARIKRICEMMIFAPLVALISAVINGNDITPIMESIYILVTLAIIFICIVKGLRLLTYFSLDYAKHLFQKK